MKIVIFDFLKIKFIITLLRDKSLLSIYVLSVLHMPKYKFLILSMLLLSLLRKNYHSYLLIEDKRRILHFKPL